MAPDNPEVIGGLVRALVAAGEPDEAREILEGLAEDLTKKPEIARARAALEVASAAPAADSAALEARVTAAPTITKRGSNSPTQGWRREIATQPPRRCSSSSAATANGTTARPASGSCNCSKRRASKTLVERTAPPSLGIAVHMSRTLRVPLFPLPGAILFPRSQLPLHIFEPRYREMVRDAIDGGGRIAMIQPHRLDDDNQAPLYAVGCVGDVVGVEELDDGRFNIVLLGTDRFRLIARDRRSTPPIAAPKSTSRHSTIASRNRLSLVERAEVEREARRLGDALGLAVDWDAVSRLDDEMLVNAIAQVAPFDVGAKQALLEAATPCRPRRPAGPADAVPPRWRSAAASRSSRRSSS